MENYNDPMKAQMVETLELKLGELACEYRGGTAPKDHAVICEYDEVFNELLKLGFHGEPDIDAQLCNQDMPKAYKDLWNHRLNEHQARKSKEGN